jgi:hypothetical protein
MSRSEAELEFEATVERWVAAGVTEAASFGELVRALPGVDPLVALAALDRLAERRNGHSEAASRLATNARVTVPTERPTAERPVPHPLEFYWRNDDASLALLCDLLATADQGSTLVYLGMPNVFQRARESLAGYRHVVIDRSVHRMSALAAAHEVIQLDVLRDKPPPLGAAAVVTDPPWYPEHLRSFFWTSARLLSTGGTLYACLPPDGTRPGIEAQRSALLEWARTEGLQLVRYEKSAVRYVSSPFELASHRAAGLGGIPLDWRCGDLGVLRLVEVPTAQRPIPPADDGHWNMFTIEEIPIWVRDRKDDRGSFEEPLLYSLVEGDVLATVSRRDPLRASIDVWTSLNRVYSTTHPSVVQAICGALAERHDPVTAIDTKLLRELSAAEGRTVSKAAARLETIVAEERAIHGFGEA